MSQVASENEPSTAAPPTLALTVMVFFDALLAVVLGPALATTLALLLEVPRHPAHDGTALGVAIILMILLMPSVLGFGCVLACVSWVVHALASRPRPIAIDAAFGLLAGLVIGAGFLAQDVMGIRPETPSEIVTDPQSITIVATSAVVGGLMGFASGAIAHHTAGRFPSKTPTSARVAGGLNLLLLYGLGLPAVAMLFTFAHFTGRNGSWEFLATPFVFFLALAVLAGLGVPLLAALGGIVAAHHLLARGLGTFLLDAVVAMGLAALALVIGVSLFEDGMDNFRDLPSFGVAATAAATYCGVLGATFGLAWRTSR